MEELNSQRPELEGTQVGRFLAYRGVMIVKEFRNIGKLKGRFGDSVSVATMILAIVKGTNRETSFGVKLERTDVHGKTESSGFLDFDELSELIQAFDFIASLAGELRLQERDYTEVTYSTKDMARFGFYQKAGEQNAFIAVSRIGSSAFLPVEQLNSMKELLLLSRQHLISRGATNG